MLEDCRYGQSLGFGSVWVLEHHFTDYYPSPSPLLFLSHVAAACPGLGLGTAVIVLPWYEPVRFAEDLAMLSVMTDAELHIGLGRGVARIEYDARAIDMAHSRDLFREHYEIADGLLSGKPFRYEGTHARIPRQVTLRPGPARERIHLYGACNNPGTAERMAEMGLGLLCTSASPFRQNADSIGAWKAIAAANGGQADANLPLWIHCFIADSEAEAREEAITYLAAFFHAVVAHYETHANPWKDVPTYERNVQQMERMEAMADPANLPALPGAPIGGHARAGGRPGAALPGDRHHPIRHQHRAARPPRRKPPQHDGTLRPRGDPAGVSGGTRRPIVAKFHSAPDENGLRA